MEANAFKGLLQSLRDDKQMYESGGIGLYPEMLLRAMHDNNITLDEALELARNSQDEHLENFVVAAQLLRGKATDLNINLDSTT